MTDHSNGRLDAHAKPPEELRLFYKRIQKLKKNGLEDATEILDLNKRDGLTQLSLAIEATREIRESHSGETQSGDLLFQLHHHRDGELRVYEYPEIPGLKMIPNLLSVRTQRLLLERLLLRDLSNPIHLSNVHLHYNVEYPPGDASFFSLDPDDKFIQQPIDPSVHKPITIKQFLEKKLRWITLGGQYDWTNKVYPQETPPDFPTDIAELLQELFPEMAAQAAIVNFYSPGDQLSLHRDVAEDCARGLVSISLGCDGVFVLGLEQDTIKGDKPDDSTKLKSLAVRLRSGDAVFMTGLSRYAWHGVPMIVPDTCPEELRNWPGDAGYGQWRGWMTRKRINLNVRQMRE